MPRMHSSFPPGGLPIGEHPVREKAFNPDSSNQAPRGYRQVTVPGARGHRLGRTTIGGVSTHAPDHRVKNLFG